MEEQVATQAESLPADVNAESSTATESAATEQSAEATAQKATEVPFHEHPRFKELIEERNQERERARMYEKKLLEQAWPAPGVPQGAEDDPLADEAPEAKDWYKRKIIPLAKKVAEEIINLKEKEYQKKVSYLESQVGELTVGSFLQRYPEIKRGSAEAKSIVEKIQQGHSPDDAYKIIMFDRVKEKAAQELKEKEKQTIQKKAAANVETKTIPVGSPILKKGTSTTEEVDRLTKELGLTF